jgi:hypothetical protein
MGAVTAYLDAIYATEAGDIEKAVRLIRKAEEHFRAADNPRGRYMCDLHRARIMFLQNRPLDSWQLLEKLADDPRKLDLVSAERLHSMLALKVALEVSSTGAIQEALERYKSAKFTGVVISLSLQLYSALHRVGDDARAATMAEAFVRHCETAFTACVDPARKSAYIAARRSQLVAIRDLLAACGRPEILSDIDAHFAMLDENGRNAAEKAKLKYTMATRRSNYAYAAAFVNLVAAFLFAYNGLIRPALTSVAFGEHSMYIGMVGIPVALFIVNALCFPMFWFVPQMRAAGGWVALALSNISWIYYFMSR